jgi:murein L,D-transpeptidase YcbB/YkuD
MMPPAGAVEKEKSFILKMQNLLRIRIEAQTAGTVQNEGSLIYAHQALPLFYEKRGFLPAWIDKNGPLPIARALIDSIYQLSSDGLHPEYYHLERITKGLEKARRSGTTIGPSPEKLVELDLLLSDAFLVCGAHMVKGLINPESIDPEWFANLREVDMPAVLEKAIETQRISETFYSLRPNHKGYRMLLETLEKYRHIAGSGGWHTIPDGLPLKLGDNSSRIPLIRKRLIATGDLRSEDDKPDNFLDEELQDAVIHFQNRHGLDTDGIVGPATINAMNVPAEHRVEQIALNLERWRWLPQNLGDIHIIVNIADFSLTMHEGDLTILEMRAIVGKSYRRTPVFSDKITYLVFNPSWNIPNKLAIHDILPAIQKNPDYPAEMGIRIMSDQGTDPQVIDPKSIVWESVSRKNFPYRFRQAPGPKNPLGRIKFMFPNKFNVYIHDTPSPELFGKSSRSFSSGCIRIEKPIILAQYLLSGKPSWDSNRINAVLADGIEQTVSLPKPVPVHLLYWTTWVAHNGVVQFRKDIYGRDKILLHALTFSAPEK